jgi:imidazole glycerol phosphate synthase subunit hisH (EC 2.4.2.-)
MHNKNVVIIDYGLGNLRSVMRGLEAAGARATITGVPEEIAAADCIVLPGVGAFHEGMEQLGPVKNTLSEAVRDKVPLLGICLGMQMLMDSSEEHGTYRGLGFVPGSVRRFPQELGKKVPHMGWNTVRLAQPDNPLFAGISAEQYMYFVHSYYAETTPEYTLTETEYILPFASSVVSGNVYGVQFHPEKSGAAGLKILKNFVGLI